MSKIERIAFFGTPAFAVPTLEALAAADRSPQLVVSQPARRAGRGRQVVEPPVAQWALDHGVRLEQPEKVRAGAFLELLREFAPDLAVVVAFGQIFPQKLLDIPRLGCVNVHASLLPAYRGAAPIAAAIRAGDEVTGVTTMVMEKGLDSGPMLLKAEIPIGDQETCGELTPRLAALGGDLLVQTLAAMEEDALKSDVQDHGQATFAPRLEKSDGIVDFSENAHLISCHLRAFDPWPGTFGEIRDRPLRLVAGRTLESKSVSGAAPGEIVGLEDGVLIVACGGGSALGLEQVQRPGKRAMNVRDWMNGERLEAGETFAPISSQSSEAAS